MNSLFSMLKNKRQKNPGTELRTWGAPSSRREPLERGWCPSSTIRHGVFTLFMPARFRHGSLRMHPLHSFTKFLSVVEQGSRSDKFMHVRISRFSQNWGFGCHRCHSVLKHRRTAISPQRFILHSISALCLFIVVVLSLHSLRIQPPSPRSSLLRTSVSRGRECRLNLPSRIPDVPGSAKRPLYKARNNERQRYLRAKACNA